MFFTHSTCQKFGNIKKNGRRILKESLLLNKAVFIWFINTVKNSEILL